MNENTTTNDPSDEFLNRCEGILQTIRNQKSELQKSADWFADSILAGRMVHLFGSGHSRIMVEEMWPRYGSFPGFNPMVELSLTYHNAVVGSNGQRQAMFLENVSGLANQILRNFALNTKDSALVISSSGCNVVPIEIAQGFQNQGIRVVALVSKAHSEASTSNHPEGIKLTDVADLVLDTGAPSGDSMVNISGLDTPVSPGSSVGGCMIINALKAEIAHRLTQAGAPPKVLTSGTLIGRERATQLFNAAYDEHARRLAPYYAELEKTHQKP
ncbi:MAG TPA: sugar isomerase domain-containing protein [Verrucomicrobiales bacterium]|nr:sugar isomerase domain-containing protein [Verrucomicrobiales bacterium]HIL71405.1 sugar isomerase domain-containing protein [Verrucomicrobiota bacterium]